MTDLSRSSTTEAAYGRLCPGYQRGVSFRNSTQIHQSYSSWQALKNFGSLQLSWKSSTLAFNSSQRGVGAKHYGCGLNNCWVIFPIAFHYFTLGAVGLTIVPLCSRGVLAGLHALVAGTAKTWFVARGKRLSPDCVLPTASPFHQSFRRPTIGGGL